MTTDDQTTTTTTQTGLTASAPASPSFVPRRLVAIELEAPLLERLKAFSWDPRQVKDHSRRGGLLDADYIGELNLTEADVPELIEISRQWASSEWFDQFPPARSEDEAGDRDPYEEGPVFAPLHAWFALGQLSADAGLEALIDLFPELEEFGDDWYLEEMRHVFARFGERAVPRLTEVAADPNRDEHTIIEAHCGLTEIGKKNPGVRDQVVAILTDSMRRFDENGEWINGLLISHLTELKAVESADVMEDAHAAGRVDVSIYGGWSNVCEELGIERSDRITPEFEAEQRRRFDRFGISFRRAIEHHQRKQDRREAKKAAEKRKANRKKKRKGKRKRRS